MVVRRWGLQALQQQLSLGLVVSSQQGPLALTAAAALGEFLLV
jgi:hypothetical protein